MGAARRRGGRIIAPKGDCLKELLERVEKADPGNSDANTLRGNHAAVQLGRKGALALRRNHIDESVTDFEGLTALKPEDGHAKHEYARALRMRAERLLERRRPNGALIDVNLSLELEPDNTASRIVLADILLAQNKPTEAADEYQRILDGKPSDKRARRGLQQATMAKVRSNRPKKKH